MDRFVTVYHPDLDTTATVGVRSLPARLRAGWVLAESPADPVGDPDPTGTDPGVGEPVPEGDETTPEPEDETS